MLPPPPTILPLESSEHPASLQCWLMASQYSVDNVFKDFGNTPVHRLFGGLTIMADTVFESP